MKRWPGIEGERKMALFSKEAETNSRPQHSYEPSQSPAAFAIQPLAGENVAPARDAAPTLREASVAPRKPVDARAYLDSRTKINGKLSFEGPSCAACGPRRHFSPRDAQRARAAAPRTAAITLRFYESLLRRGLRRGRAILHGVADSLADDPVRGEPLSGILAILAEK